MIVATEREREMGGGWLDGCWGRVKEARARVKLDNGVQREAE